MADAFQTVCAIIGRVPEHIDTGFYRITEREARKLGNNKLPRVGHMFAMKFNEQGEPEGSMTLSTDRYKIQRTQVGGKTVWAVWGIKD